MDNITHTLLGVTVAQAAVRFRKKPPTPALLTATATWVSVAANNFPDLDALLSPLAPAPLGYLLHHRGHTHTLIGAIPQMLLILGSVAAWFRFKRISIPWKEWRWLAAITLCGLWLHVFADSWNSYGVHPFWPFDSRWFYGDSVFILEPSLWMILIPPLVIAAKTKRTRVVLLSLGIGILAVALGTKWVPNSITVVMSVFALGWGYFLTRVKTRAQSTATLSVLALSITGWFLLSTHVKNMITATVTQPDTKIVDIVAVPAPANPGCWQVIVATLGTQPETEGIYRTRSGIYAPWPSWQSAQECPRLTTDTLSSVSPQLAWGAKFEAPIEELRNIRDRDCRARAFLKFSRVPAWTRDYLSDERFVRGPRFGKIPIDTGLPCPRGLPGWIAPRADLFAPTSRNTAGAPENP